MPDDILDIVIKTLRYFSFASIGIAFMVDTARLREVKIFPRIAFITILVALLAFYNPIMDEGVEIFESMTASGDSEIDAYLDRCRTVRIEGDSGFFDDFMTSLQANFFKVLLSCTGGLRFISSLLQGFLITMFKALAPVLFGIVAWEAIRSKLQSFLLYTLAVMMWPVGYLIADVAILKGIILIGVPNALSAGTGAIVVTGGGALLGFIVFLIALFFGMCVFYIITPLLIFTVLGGGNPATAITGSMRTATLATMAAGRPGQQFAAWNAKRKSGGNGGGGGGGNNSKSPASVMNMTPGAGRIGGGNNKAASASKSLASAVKQAMRGKK